MEEETGTERPAAGETVGKAAGITPSRLVARLRGHGHDGTAGERIAMTPDDAVTPDGGDVNTEGRNGHSTERSERAISALVLVSRLTGFIRTTAQAYALGVTAIASCYSVANNLPNMLYELVIGGMIVTAFLPTYLRQSAMAEGAGHQSTRRASPSSCLR